MARSGLGASSWAEVCKHRRGRTAAEEAVRAQLAREGGGAGLDPPAGNSGGVEEEAGDKRREGASGGAEGWGVCPAGHDLKAARAPGDEGWQCDGCGEGLVPGCAIVCCEPCDFDLCQACALGCESAAARRAARRAARSRERGGGGEGRAGGGTG